MLLRKGRERPLPYGRGSVSCRISEHSVSEPRASASGFGVFQQPARAIVIAACLAVLAGGMQSKARKKNMQPSLQGVTMSVRPEVKPDRLVLHYQVENNSPTDIYVLDDFPGYDDAGKRPVPLPQAAYICLRNGGVVFIRKGMPPLPLDRTVNAFKVPYATKLGKGEKLERSFTRGLPLAEENPYYEMKKPEEHDLAGFHTIDFEVQFVRPTMPGFTVEPLSDPAGFYKVRTRNIPADAEAVRQELRLPELRILRRRDNFTRI